MKINKILIYKGLILDVLFNRKVDHLESSVVLFDLIAEEKIKGCISQRDWNDIRSLINFIKRQEDRNSLLETLERMFEIVPLDWNILNNINSYKLSDFDNAFLVACAQKAEVDAIVLENSNELNYRFGKIKIIGINEIDNYINWLVSDQPSDIESFDHIWLDEARENFINIYRNNSSSKTSDIVKIANWIIEKFEIKHALNCYSQATLNLRNLSSGKQIQENASGEGAIEVICKALKNALGSTGELPSYEFESIRISNIDPKLNSEVLGTVILKSNVDSYYKGHAINKDSVIAGFYAYAKALNNLLIDNPYQSNTPGYELTADYELTEIELDILSKYAEGEKEFIQADLVGADFSNKDLSNINLSKASLENAQFYKSILTEANFHFAYLNNANLNRAILRQANLQKACLHKAKLQEATLDQAKLQQANLIKTDLTEASLSKANLSEANLSEADLTEANLSGANLSGADLSHVKFEHTNLTDANLNRAKLGKDGIDLRKVNLENAELKEMEPDYEILKLHTLEKEVEELATSDQISLETFKELVQKVEISDEFLLKLVSFDKEHFVRKRIFEKKHITVYVIGWKPKHFAGRHHHNSSLDAIRIIQGKMTHWKFDKVDKSNPEEISSMEGFLPNQLDREKEGEELDPKSGLILIDRWTMHQIENNSEENLVTLHFRYGTPPDKNDQYWVSENRLSWL
jgi:uncharacterized protein YjbI with pentapeptide repeats